MPSLIHNLPVIPHKSISRQGRSCYRLRETRKREGGSSCKEDGSCYRLRETRKREGGSSCKEDGSCYRLRETRKREGGSSCKEGRSCYRECKQRSPVFKSALFDFCKRSLRMFPERAITVAVIDFHWNHYRYFLSSLKFIKTTYTPAIGFSSPVTVFFVRLVIEPTLLTEERLFL
ncbi:MAG: hypothetical protein NHB32_27025 [Fischerella sp. CENA71]|nr:hypothetical protein [Fischerella sp. CENA71]